MNFRYFYFQLAKFFSDAHTRPLEEILTSEEDRKFFSDALWRYLIYFLPPKLQRRGLVFEGKMVTMERVMGYYGTCDGLL